MLDLMGAASKDWDPPGGKRSSLSSSSAVCFAIACHIKGVPWSKVQ